MTPRVSGSQTWCRGPPLCVSWTTRSSLTFIPLSGGRTFINNKKISPIKCRAAFKYAKIFSGEEELETKENPEAAKPEASGAIVKSKVEATLNFDEFRIFFFAMRQYLIYCQVGGKAINC